MKLEKREEEKAKKEAGQGENIPDNLITWVFQDDFIPVSYTHLDVYKRQPVEPIPCVNGKFIWRAAMKTKCGGFTRNRQMIPFWLMPFL